MSVRGRIVKAGKRTDEAARRVSPARRAAFEILRRVEDENAFAAPLLANLPGDLSGEDRALCYELVLGVLRYQLQLDKLLEYYAGRNAGALDAPIRRALRLGLYQLRFLARIPARAAVNESVNLAHAARLRSAAPFINAVLRRATREPDFDPATLAVDSIEKLSIETSHPRRLIEHWSAAFGVDEAEALAHANNRPAPAAFRINSPVTEEAQVIERLRAAGVTVGSSRIAPGAWRVESGPVSTLRELAGEGSIYMQDEASQLVAHVLGARACERVLDACAAPGSKTTHVAALTAGRALVVAGDLHEHRLRVAAELSAKQHLESIRAVVLNAEKGLPFADESFDRALVDAPCTGTGTLRHNPEIRWRITPGDIEELSARQGKILGEVCRTVRRGGRLVYSTCSVEIEENEAVVAAFLRAHGDFRQVEATPAPQNLLTPEGAARTWPHRDGTDGFFVAAFERAS